MEGIYNVYFGRQTIGKVQLIRQGLYYRVICHCRQSGEEVLRLYFEGEQHRENLGVVIPDGESLKLDKMIPAKRITGENPRFELLGTTARLEGIYVPIYPEEPFAYIKELKDAFLVSNRGKIGVQIPKIPEVL